MVRWTNGKWSTHDADADAKVYRVLIILVDFPGPAHK